MDQETVYIHYGSDRFRTPDPIRNREYFTKPRGGLWASRKDESGGWKSLCECEEFRVEKLDYHFTFRLKPNARVLELNQKDQLDDLPKQTSSDYRDGEYAMCILDFEQLVKEYDAIEVTNIGPLYWRLYGWDCKSILIMNPDIVDILEEGKL